MSYKYGGDWLRRGVRRRGFMEDLVECMKRWEYVEEVYYRLEDHMIVTWSHIWSHYIIILYEYMY